MAVSAAAREVEKRIGILISLLPASAIIEFGSDRAHGAGVGLAQAQSMVWLGYEDLNDHEELRNDPLLAVLVEKSDPVKKFGGKSTRIDWN